MKKLLLFFIAVAGFGSAFAQREIAIATPTGIPIVSYEILYEYSLDERTTMLRMLEEWIVNWNSSAVIVGEVTAKYNAHGYALHMSDGQPRKLNITELKYGVYYNIEKYWLGDAPTFTRTYNTATAKKVFYSKADHTGVVRGPNLIESKWGIWPVMLHAPADCPYDTLKIQYYGLPIAGNDFLCTSGTYSTLDIPDATYTWASDKIAVQGSGSSVNASMVNIGSGWIQGSIYSPYSLTTIQTEKKAINLGINASFSGPATILYLGTGNFSATASCGVEPYNFEWYLKKGPAAYNYIGSGQYLTLMSVASKNNELSLPATMQVSDAEVESTPSSFLKPTQVNSDPIRHQPVTTTAFTIKLRVVDANGNSIYTQERPLTAMGKVNLIRMESIERMMPNPGLEITSEQSMQVYPNPASTTVNISILDNNASDPSSTYQVQILDKNMRLVKEVQTKTKQFTIPVSELRKDLYFIQVTGKGKPMVERFLVE